MQYLLLLYDNSSYANVSQYHVNTACLVLHAVSYLSQDVKLRTECG